MPHIRTLRTFAPEDLEAARRLADAVEARSGVAPFGGETWSGLENRSVLGDVGLAVDSEAGDLAAYGHLAHHHPKEWSLDLAARDAESDLLPSLLRAAVTAVATDGGGHLTLWAHGATDADDKLARDAGFTTERDLLQLRVGLPLPTEAIWPDGIVVRSFAVGQDEAEWVEVNNRAFAGHPEQGDWNVDTLRQRELEPWFDPDGFLVAVDDDGMAGFCWTKVHTPDPPREPVALGEIYVIGADPRMQGLGLGRALTTGGLDVLAQRGIAVGMLYVDGANEAAVGLYRALGFTDHRVDRAYGRDVSTVDAR
jgi:mycothiol synthase